MPRFAPDRLRALAGDAAFARGEAYRTGGAVSLLSADAEEVLAVVRGGEDYRVRLRGGGGGARVAGECTCPAFDRDGWCKHLVAAALAVNDAGEEVPDRRGAVRTHLLALGAEALADMLLELAWRDPALLRRLDLTASAASAPAAEHAARLQQALRGALRPGRFVDYDEAGDWTEAALDVLEQVRALIAGDAAGEAKTLLETALDELPEALEQVDDSDGAGMEILERAAALHLEACRALRPDPVALAGELFERAWDGDAFGTFDRADEGYADLLGEAGLAEYRRLAEAAHARLPPVARGGADPKADDRRRLTEMLDRFAARAGDLDRRIALRRAALTDAQDHLTFARFCLEQGRPALALQAAEDGAWLFEDAPGTTPLVEFLAERLLAEGRAAEAVAALWRGFERAPSLVLFRALLAQGAPDAADRALAALRGRRAALGKADRRRLGALVELEVEILMASGRLPDAWDAARRHGAPDGLLMRLALASEEALPGDAAHAYRTVLERQIGLTHRHGYEEACRLLARLAPIESPAEHAAFVVALRARHRAKRTLVPMLDRHLAKQAGR